MANARETVPLVQKRSDDEGALGDETGPRANSTRGSGAAVVLVLIVFLLLPLLYVLSIGPAVWWVSRRGIIPGPDSAIARFYAPLEYVHNRWPTVAAPLDWYVELWRADPPVQSFPTPPVAPPPVRAAPMPVPSVQNGPASQDTGEALKPVTPDE